SSAGAEDFTLDVGLSATAAEAVDESVVAADEGVFLAGVDLAAAEDSAAVVADEEFFTVFVAELCDTVGVVSVVVFLLPAVFVSVLFASAVFLLADGFAVEDFFVVEAVAAEVLRVPDFAAVAPEPPAFVPAVFVPAAFVPAVVDRVVDFFGVDADPLVLLVAVLSSDASVALCEAAAFVLRRREDCMDAAGSLRAAREVFSFSASPVPSSALLPEKKTSTGRSVEFASGINAPSPRPRPRFLRSATTYSSIRYFLSGFAV